MKLKKFHEPDISNFKESFHIPGILVFSKPIIDDSEAKKYFGVKLLKKNILAVYASVINRNSNKSFIISEDSIKITQIENVSAKNRPEKESENAAIIGSSLGIPISIGASAAIAAATYPTAVAAGALIAVPVAEVAIPIFVSKQMSDASVIKENYEFQKFRVTTLEPGEKESGFVYFDWKKLKGYKEANLCFYLQDSMSNEIYSTCYYLSLRSNKDE